MQTINQDPYLFTRLLIIYVLLYYKTSLNYEIVALDYRVGILLKFIKFRETDIKKIAKSLNNEYNYSTGKKKKKTSFRVYHWQEIQN